MNFAGLGSVRAAMRYAFILVVALLALVACNPQESHDQGSLVIVAMAGPTCPVESDPPDPNCAPRPVPRAPISVAPADSSDNVIAEGETDAEGRLTFEVPAGDYLVTAGEVEGLTTSAEPVLVTVLPNLSIELPVAYDTGIR